MQRTDAKAIPEAAPRATTHWRRRCLACGLGPMVALLMLCGSAQAATFTVNSTGDGCDVPPETACADRGRDVHAARGDAGSAGAGRHEHDHPVRAARSIDDRPRQSAADDLRPDADDRRRGAGRADRPARLGRRLPIFTTNASAVTIRGMTITNGRAVPQGGPVVGGGSTASPAASNSRRRGRRQRGRDERRERVCRGRRRLQGTGHADDP